MGRPKRRVSPRLANQVNRDFDHLVALSLIAVVRDVDPPWERNSSDRPCWDPRVVAVCLFMKVFLNRSYDGIEAYFKTSTDKKGKPFLCFKANATGKARGYPAWQISFKAYTDNPDEWMEEYHIRSIVEAVFSSLKRCWGPDVRSIKGWLKRRELALKVVAYNVKRVLYIERAKDLGIPLWVNCQ